MEVKEDLVFIVTASVLWLTGLGYTFLALLEIIKEPSSFNIFWFSLGVLLFSIGVGIRLYCRFLLKSDFTYMLKTSEHQKLITTGPYNYVRHPAYAGDILAQIAIPLAIMSWIGVLIMTTLIFPFLYRIIIEEEMLVRRFGVPYQDYQKVTKRLIPWIY